ncbi:hypothetical protein HOLleu_35191 [Holothuria leucospilota]|uniref:Reverse transcriptase domain-containing protein n=1 Tax=Holothuria leucospilota TaxID=206669 RepID=A0A9Q1BGQ6_HOLLE|nr:hypothetical protein HOLleu_35191 [Holothuria leucospilota]
MPPSMCRVPMHLSSHRFLTFRYKNVDYAFKAVLFSLSTSPRVFTRVTRAVLSFLRWRGITLFTYLDDWLLLANSEIEAHRTTQLMIQLLKELGKDRQQEQILTNSFPGDHLLRGHHRPGVRSHSSNHRKSGVFNHFHLHRHQEVLPAGQRMAKAYETNSKPRRRSTLVPSLHEVNPNSSTEIIQTHQTPPGQESSGIPRSSPPHIQCGSKWDLCMSPKPGDHLHGHFPRGMGSSMGYKDNFRVLDRERVSSPHQSPRAGRDLPGHQSLGPISKEQGGHSPIAQHNSHNRHQSTVRNDVQIPLLQNVGHPAPVPMTGDPPEGLSHGRPRERHGQRIIK